ncbi:hypothetical protein Tsubulata_022914 [Turnera subulata]|uniref:KIB1-4 beta-propeller domain-containing protein n=1 Tax=Turnera subulata TaxID=218843 RepID=A0A9Q0FVG8_9ROSI|nr:hypothetical protein Tsubulata_022914 [Turnera subulata]
MASSSGAVLLFHGEQRRGGSRVRPVVLARTGTATGAVSSSSSTWKRRHPSPFCSNLGGFVSGLPALLCSTYLRRGMAVTVWAPTEARLGATLEGLDGSGWIHLEPDRIRADPGLLLSPPTYMIPYRDGFCGLYGQGSGIMQLSFSSSPEVIKRTRVKVQREDVHKSREKYLVKSSNGDLLMVVLVPACDDGDGRLASGFEVFRLDWCKREWTVVKSLGNHAIFLARYGSTCVEASGNPAATGCIYLFSDSGLRIYNVESRSFQATKPKKIPNSVCHWFCPDVGCKSR